MTILYGIAYLFAGALGAFLGSQVVAPRLGDWLEEHHPRVLDWWLDKLGL
jgi:hypothetical protein